MRILTARTYGASPGLRRDRACGEARRRRLWPDDDLRRIGRGAILHHDFPRKVEADAGFTPIALPVPEAHLVAEGLGPVFVNYMKTWKGFVAETTTI